MMKRLCGFFLFSFGLGMAFMIFLPVNFCTTVVILSLLIVGYNLFCCGK